MKIRNRGLILIKKKQIKKPKKQNCSKNILLIFLIIEIYILIANLLYMYNNNKYHFFISLNRSDNYFIKMISNSYEQISDYLYKKYSLKNNSINDNSIKTVKIYNENMHPRWIELIKRDLEGKINIKIDKDNPDYLIYATFGCEHVLNKYNNTIKIAFFTENQLPDLNYADYAVGFGHINHLDRFFTYPYIAFELEVRHITPQMIENVRKNVLNSQSRKKFCAAIISNPVGFRLDFINELNKYKKLDMGGHFRNNVGGYINDKIKFLNDYKFSLAMENSEGDGYLTEKILDAFLAGTIPIYYGDYTLDEYINPKTYILIRSEQDALKKIEYIKQIDNDDNLYRSIMKEKVFDDEYFLDNIIKERKKFLLHIFEQKKEFAKRVDNYHFDFNNN